MQNIIGIRQGDPSWDKILPGGFALMALPCLANVLARILHADGAILFLLGPFFLLGIVALPMLAVAETWWLYKFLISDGREYRKLLPHFFAISFFVLSLLLALSVNSDAGRDWCFRLGRLTTDAELIGNFRTNKSDFERLLSISDQPETAEVKRIVRKLKLKGDIGRTSFGTYRDGGKFGGEAKGYVYLLTPPAPILPSIEEPIKSDTRTIYRKIDDKWYIYLTWW